MTMLDTIDHRCCILDVVPKTSVWMPPEIDAYDLAMSVRNDINASQSRQCLYVFQGVPYIDSLYIEYDENRIPLFMRRFTFRENHYWDSWKEIFFLNFVVKSGNCAYTGVSLDSIYEYLNNLYPQWHLQRYYKNGFKLLDHIYHCIRQNTVKEILYKSGLDELAIYSDEIEDLNLLSTNPTELYDGVPLKVLRKLNCKAGSKLLTTKNNRDYLKNLYTIHPDVFEETLNDAQCMYLDFLIRGDLTAGEIWRLFKARRKQLEHVWSESFVELFLQIEERKRDRNQVLKQCGKLDPIIDAYLSHVDERWGKDVEELLLQYLTSKRKEYDWKIKCSNRKRDYSWQERKFGYYVRYPQTVLDYCREALYMRNCLLWYVEAMVSNETTILFLRKNDDANTPFITMEVHEGVLEQAYHRYNRWCTKKEEEWIWEYCQRHGIRTKTQTYEYGFTQL